MRFPSASDRRYAAVVTTIWTAAALLFAWSHEMWRDELQAWMIARSSSTIAELVANGRYEGHPLLWPLCLFLVSRLTSWPGAMQILNVAIGAGTVYLLVRHAPFPRPLRIGLGFSYFFLYEYTVISRSYGLGVLCVVAFCALWTTRRSRGITLAIPLALLAWTSVYGVIAATALACGVLVDAVVRRPTAEVAWRSTAALVLVVGLACTFSLLQMRQPPDAGFPVEPFLTFEGDALARTAGAIFTGLAPVPPLETTFWNRSVLDGTPKLKAVLGLAALALCGAVLRGSPAALATFLANAGGMMLFGYLIYSGGVRHHGHHFVLFVAASWMASASARPRPWAGGWLLGGLAVIHIVAAAIAVTVDWKLPFSGSPAAAAFIRSHFAGETPVVADPELPGVPIAAWIGRDVYFAQSERWGAFVTWNDRRQPASVDRAVEAADRLARTLGRDVVLVTAYRDRPPARFEHVGRFDGPIVESETYDIYLLRGPGHRRSALIW